MGVNCLPNAIVPRISTDGGRVGRGGPFLLARLSFRGSLPYGNRIYGPEPYMYVHTYNDREEGVSLTLSILTATIVVFIR